MALDLRLSDAEPDLAALISDMSAFGQRSLAATLAEKMLSDVGMDPVPVRSALAAETFGDTSVRTDLRRRATSADALARKAMAARDPNWQQINLPARALTAAFYALGPDPEEAALEVVYELHYAYPRGDAMRLIIELLRPRLPDRFAARLDALVADEPPSPSPFPTR